MPMMRLKLPRPTIALMPAKRMNVLEASGRSVRFRDQTTENKGHCFWPLGPEPAGGLIPIERFSTGTLGDTLDCRCKLDVFYTLLRKAEIGSCKEKMKQQAKVTSKRNKDVTGLRERERYRGGGTTEADKGGERDTWVLNLKLSA